MHNTDATPVIRSVDVGYGMTKYIVEDLPNGSMRCDAIPSLSPYSPDHDISEGFGSRRRTMKVAVQGVVYEVGKDADLLMSRHGSNRVLHEQYVQTPEYEALLKGALRLMDQPVIDLLVMGLPVELLSSKADALKQMATGRHIYPDGSKVEVRQAMVMAQPLGGLLDHFSREQNTTVSQSACESTHLLVDPGYYTLDWVVARGLSVRPELSRSVPCGMADFLAAIAKAVSRTTSSPYTNLTAIDQGLQTGRFVAEGRPYELQQHVPEARLSLRAGLRELQNVVGAGLDIRSVYVMGGGAKYFAEMIQEVFPKHSVLSIDDPCFANVRGFQWAGRSYWKRLGGMAA